MEARGRMEMAAMFMELEGPVEDEEDDSSDAWTEKGATGLLTKV